MSKRPPHTRRIPLSCERLEDRLPLAGNITATLAGNTLKIKGDVEANVLTIQADVADPTKFTLSSSSGTINTGGDFTTPTGVKHFLINLLGGDDRVTFGNAVAPIVVQGNVTINGGDGANDVFGTDLTVQKNLTIINGNNVAGSDDADFGNLNVGGSVNIKNGKGDSSTNIYRNSPGLSKINGSLSIINGIGEDNAYIVDTNIGKHVTISNGKGSANGIAGETQFYNEENTTQRSTIGGNVTVSYADGNANPGEADGIWDYEVFGNVTFNHGTGVFRTDFDGYSVNQPAAIRGHLTINGKGAQTVVTGNEYFKTGLTVGKNFTLNAGAGADVVTLDKLNVTGKASFNLGNGANTVTVINGGDTTAQKSLSITGGKDVDTVQFNARVNTPKLTLTLKDGGDVFNSTVGIFGNAAGSLRAAMTANLGKGDDTVNIDNIFGGVVNLNLGHGINTVTVDHPNVVRASVNGGNGVDTVTASNGNVDTLIAKLFGDADILNALNLDISTRVDINGGPGIDTLNQVGGSIPANLAKIKVSSFP